MNSKYVAPAKAQKVLKAARSLYQTIYICGATGYGKTELVKQYLSHRNYIYYSCTENLDFKEIPIKPAGRKNRDTCSIVVIDDLHVLRNEKKQKEILALTDRDDIWLFLISRSRIPVWLIPAHLNNAFLVISEDMLRLNEAEAAKIFLRFAIELSPEQLREIVNDSEGNPYMLSVAGRLISEGMQPGVKLYEECARLFSKYMENVVFSQWEPELLEFLMQISVVDAFDVPLAVMITGNSYVNRLLQMAVEDGNFLSEKDGVWHLRPILLTAMRRRAEIVCGNEHMKDYAYNAGLYYEMHDRIPEALAMYEKSGRDDRIRELLIRNSRRNPGNGHYFEMRRYYLNLKKEEIEESVILMAAMSMLYSLMMQPEESEYWYEKLAAYEKTARGGQRREAKSRLAYLDIALPHRGSKGMLHILKNLPTMILEKGISLPEFSVTSNLPSTMNGGKDFCHWSKHDRELAASVGKLVQTILGRYGRGLVNAALGESLYEKGGDTYEVLALLTRADVETMGGGTLEIAFAAEGIKTRLYLLNGDIETAKLQLDSFEKRVLEGKARQLLQNIGAMKCRLALYEGDKETVSRWLKEAPDEEQEFYILERYRYLTKVRCYLARGEEMKALSLLERLRYYAEQCQRTYVKMEVGLLMAVVRERRGLEWKPGLIEVLHEACEYHFLRFISEEGPIVSGLLQQVEADCLADNQIEDGWFKRLLRETADVAVRYPVYIKRQLSAQDFFGNALAILRLQAEGLTAAQIAGQMGLKERTVRYHISENYRKLGVTGKADAVLAARNLNLL